MVQPHRISLNLLDDPSSAMMTLDTYGHLFDDRLDEVADEMDLARARERPGTAQVRPAEEGQVPAVARRCSCPERRRPPDRRFRRSGGLFPW